MYTSILMVAGNDFLKMEEVLDRPWLDVSQHIVYLSDKAYADDKEYKFKERIRSLKRN